MARDTHKKFGSNRPEPKVGLTFDLEGDGWAETFHVKPVIPAEVVSDFVASISVGKGVLSNPDAIAFLRVALATEVLVTPANPDGDEQGGEVYEPADDLDRFNALVADGGDRTVHAQDLMDAALWIVGEHYGRPTSPSRR